MRRRRAFASVTGVALLLAGCGGGTTLGSGGSGGSGGFVFDHSIEENAIEVGIAKQQHVLTIVSCPVGIHAVKGQHFNCTVTFAKGNQGSVTVIELDARGDVSYTGLQGFVGGRKVR